MRLINFEHKQPGEGEHRSTILLPCLVPDPTVILILNLIAMQRRVPHAGSDRRRSKLFDERCFEMKKGRRNKNTIKKGKPICSSLKLAFSLGEGREGFLVRAA